MYTENFISENYTTETHTYTNVTLARRRLLSVYVFVFQTNASGNLNVNNCRFLLFNIITMYITRNIHNKLCSAVYTHTHTCIYVYVIIIFSRNLIWLGTNKKLSAVETQTHRERETHFWRSLTLLYLIRLYCSKLIGTGIPLRSNLSLNARPSFGAHKKKLKILIIIIGIPTSPNVCTRTYTPCIRSAEDN